MTGMRERETGLRGTYGQWHRVRPYLVYLGFLLVYYLSALALGLHPTLGRGLSAAIGIRIVPILIVFYFFGAVAWIGLVHEGTWRGTARRIREEVLSRDLAERLVGIPLFIMGTVYTFDIYATFKQAIPELAGYSWDARLATADAFLHLGRDPWRWSYSLLGSHGLHLLDGVYRSWYAVLVGSIPVFTTWAPMRLRSRFFLTFTVMMMVGGSFMAVLFASGGPAYFAELVGDQTRFAPLLDNLRGTHALAIQNRLWDYFSHDARNLYGGISAMPSMHVAVVTLLALAACSWNPWMGLTAAVYALLIFLGSFHLGWHYAVDGYASAFLVGGTWWVIGRAIPTRPPSAQARANPGPPPS